jgi:hypothetical protein
MVTLDEDVIGEARRSLAEEESVRSMISDWLQRHV